MTKRGLRWRHLFRVLHRDIGYCAVALTIAYALSGIAVNHAEDWDPNRAAYERELDVGRVPAGSFEAQAAYIVARLDIDRRVRGHNAETETRLRIFYDEGAEAEIDTTTGRGTYKWTERRAVLFELNELHLNNLKGAWTWIADIFAIALVILAITGMTMMKGDRGLGGRGKYFVLAGLSIPITAIVYLHW